MFQLTGLAPWEFEFPFPGILISAFLGRPASDFISDNVSIKWCISSHFIHEPVDLLFAIPGYKIKLTGFGGS